MNNYKNEDRGKMWDMRKCVREEEGNDRKGLQGHKRQREQKKKKMQKRDGRKEREIEG